VRKSARRERVNSLAQERRHGTGSNVHVQLERRKAEVKALIEPPELILRGGIRRRFPLPR